ncbi:hypothetical protein SLEP1_g58991 [Rubroshorea leprosula]|uniref:Uncharacterized protein n=1 Tax=Rubroshorea leprosula TaxID=152421 RepID=A0AAV5MUL9_9ROSI|nr:hypothetical protein SLEP1_g58991 [Rubroshorea leprosula]
MTDALTRLRYTLSYPLTSSSSFASPHCRSPRSLSTLNVPTLLSFSRRATDRTNAFLIKHTLKTLAGSSRT